MPSSPLLELESVSRSFGGVRAAAGVSFSLERGTVRGLIGPNGAGKTTLINLITGMLRPDAGAIRLQGRRIDRLPAFRIAQLGVRRTYQNIRLFPSMTVRDNVVVGLHAVRRDAFWQRLAFTPGSRRAERRLHEQAMELLKRTGVASRAGARAGDLSYGQQRRLEIARALASRPQLLLLDEPTAGMAANEANEIGVLIRAIAREGAAVLLVEHNVDLVMEVSDALTVLNFGQVIAEGSPAEVRHDPRVIEAYLGSG